MTRSNITGVANEKSTFVVRFSNWVDDANTAVLPNSFNWTLSTFQGEVINNRLNVEEAPADPLNIVMFGDDLAVLIGENSDRNVKRLLTIQGTFSSNLGSDLPYNAEYAFEISPLAVVS